MPTKNLEIRRHPEQARSRAGVKAILTATANLIGEKGSDAVTMTDIAKEAKLSKAALYRYFPNKQSVIRELAITNFNQHRKSILTTKTSEPADPKQIFESELRAYCELHRSEPYRLQLRAAIHADAELSALDLADSRTNAANSADFLLKHGVTIERYELQKRILLVIELLDGLLRLITRVESSEAEQHLNQFTTMAIRQVLEPEQ
jgi:AcrR family transcriptional regulator